MRRALHLWPSAYEAEVYTRYCKALVHWALYMYESVTVSSGPQTRLPAYGP